MADAKYFQRGKIQELRSELNSEKKDSKHQKKKVVLKKIVANMTMGNDMSPLFHDVITCMQLPPLEIKKMVYLYMINYARQKPDMAAVAINSFVRDVADPNPLIRALAIRTMGYINVDKITESLIAPLRHSLKDKDPYVAKTAAICVGKLYFHDRNIVESEGLIDPLLELVYHDNPTVVANAVAVLCEISEWSDKFTFRLNVSSANKLLTALNECSEWGQAYILEAMINVVPEDHNDAELVAERIIPRLQHANSAIVLTAVRVILYLTNYIAREDFISNLYKKLGPPLITLLHNKPEIQYIALRNIMLILNANPEFLRNEIKVFFCKFDDPIYVKLAKLEIMSKIASELNFNVVLPEFKEYATEVDVDFVRKAVRSIGRCAIKISNSSDKCIETLVELVETKVNYVVQEAVVVIKDIFRKYPNKYESIISILCENLDSLDEPEAKSSMIWIIGQYSDRIDNAPSLLSDFLDNFLQEPAEVQLALLTAIVKLFIKRPSSGQDLVPKVLKHATEDVDNPDLRDRGFIYWRLLSTDPVAAKAIIFGDKPSISTETENMDPVLVEELLLHISNLASVYHKPPGTFLGGVKDRKVQISSAYVARTRKVENLDELNTANLYGNGYMSNPYAADLAISMPQLQGDQTADGENSPVLYTDIDDSHGPFDYTQTTDSPSLAFSIIQQQQQLALQQQNLLGNAPFGTATGVPAPFSPFSMLPQVSVNTAVPPQLSFNPFLTNSPVLSSPSPFSKLVVETSTPPIQIGGVPGSSQIAGLPGTPQSSGLPGTPQIGSHIGGVPTNKGYVGSISSNNSSNASPVVKSSVVLDPFGGGSMVKNEEPPKSPRKVMSPLDVPEIIFGPTASAVSSYVAPKQVLLSEVDRNGLEIEGTFYRRDGHIIFDLTFHNKGLSTISEFAMLFNKNSFGLSPATLDMQPLLPSTSCECIVTVNTDGPLGPSNPINNLQIALKTTLGVSYFQAQYPFNVLFLESGNLEAATWLTLWSDGVYADSEINETFTVTAGGIGKSIVQILGANNIFVVAERVIEGLTHLYTSSKLPDETIFLSEFKFDFTMTTCVLSIRSLKPQFSPHYANILNLVLNS
ncbi:AP-2 complex subunit beta [Nowakowskiella sp. JEL0407]|nr:AP-2 complex subunit beta [Nowakowskiella sp. JEL0407]